ncbi:MAG TPA: type II toxin-antitoxin system RelE/ParE family toxin [Sphingomonas sp.]|jgi:toxin ParE1/3/4|nr:type II toxin-antitoxin system RelE/ParE family toxin [Sphingomonas sp.]
MGNIFRRPLVLSDAIALWRYVASDDELSADALIDRIDAKLRLLADNPPLGRSRPELATGLRSFTVGNYVIYYQPTAQGIDVARILHGARDVNGHRTE